MSEHVAGAGANVYRGAVVVGDDGSPDSLAAVRWAHEDADRRGARLMVLRAWSITTAPRPSRSEMGYVPGEDEFAEAVRSEMESDLKSAMTGSSVDFTLTPVHRS